MDKNGILNVGIFLGIFLLCGCSPKPSPVPIQVNASVKDIMDSMIDPSGDFLFAAVAEIADETGVYQKAPKTDDEWNEVRYRSFVLFEGMNLAMMEGRKVARNGEKSKFPQVENEPDEIQKLIDEDRPGFFRRAKRLQDAAVLSLAAVDKRDTKALFSAIEHVDQACENCHLHYWYPKDSRALAEAKKAGLEIN
jgi:hypothetical protein